jgi:hypothetical protein
MSSPASSLIFERSVQDFYPNDEKIPTHYHDEDCIPPVLDASTSALTDSSVDPELIDVISLRRNSMIRSRSLTSSSALSYGHDSELSTSPSRKQVTNFSSTAATSLTTNNNNSTASGFGMSHSLSASASPNITPTMWVPIHNDRKVLSFYSYADIVSTEQGNVHGGATNVPSSPIKGGGAAFLTPTSSKSHSPVRENGLLRNQRSLPNFGAKYPFNYRNALVESPYEETELDPGMVTVTSLGDALRGKDLASIVINWKEQAPDTDFEFIKSSFLFAFIYI